MKAVTAPDRCWEEDRWEWSDTKAGVCTDTHTPKTHTYTLTLLDTEMQAYAQMHHRAAPNALTHMFTTHYCGHGSLSDPLLHRHSTTTKCVAEVHLNMRRMPRNMVISLGHARKHQNFIIMLEACLFVLTDKHVTSLLCQQYDSLTIWSTA